MNRQLSKGMTLIELMVVVTIIAILASIAYPSYREYVIRANRTEAKTELLNLSQAMEKCYTRYNAYDAAPCLPGYNLPRNMEHYMISAPTLNATVFVIQASPRAAQVADNAKCGALRLDNMNNRFELTDKPAVAANKCW